MKNLPWKTRSSRATLTSYGYRNNAILLRFENCKEKKEGLIKKSAPQME